jgi:nitrogen PTS system EIIA component
MMDMADFVTEDRTVLDLKGTSKRQVLSNLATLAAERTGLPEEAILDALIQREKLGTTGLGDGIAIPHARIASLPDLTGFFARLQHPVEFDALDAEPVDLVFLLLAPDAAGADHLKALARIARVLRDPELCAALRSAETPHDVFGVLTRKLDKPTRAAGQQ